MGRQTNMKFVGTVGNTVYYKLRETYCVRAKPAEVQQTEATKNSADIFGTGAKLGAAMRKAFIALLPDPKDGDMQKRVAAGWQDLLRKQQSENRQAGRLITKFENFYFNEKAGGYAVLKKMVSVLFTEPGSLNISIASVNPVQEIPAPKNTVSVNLLLAAGSFDTVAKKMIDQSFSNEQIAYTDAATEIKQSSLNFQTTQNSCIVLAAALQFNTDKNGFLLTDKRLRWQPAMIVGVWVSE